MALEKCTVKSLHGKKHDEELGIKGAHIFGPSLESKFDELKFEIIHKIDKELIDSQNARDYICQKYDELCNKIQYLTELDATVNGFRSDVRAVEKQVASLARRVDDIEKRAIYQDCPSLTSSTLQNITNLQIYMEQSSGSNETDTTQHIIAFRSRKCCLEEIAT